VSFSWLGTFRQGQWQAFRRFVLEERRDIAPRMAVIEAELTRIGEVTVLYQSSFDQDGNEIVTEKRNGIVVTPGSSLAKLLQAYIAQGGNPFDISLFLKPDTTVILDEDDPETAQAGQPYQGVVHAKSADYVPGQRYEGGYLSIKKYIPARVGGRKDMGDSQVGDRTDAARQWLRQEIRTKRDDIEARIIKLMDLREQLRGELVDITMAAAGVTTDIPALDENRYDKDLSAAHLVAAIDSVFYVMDGDNTPDFTTENLDRLANYPFLLSDDEGGEEDNTAL